MFLHKLMVARFLSCLVLGKILRGSFKKLLGKGVDWKKNKVIHMIIFCCSVSSDYKQRLANMYNINVNSV